LDVEVEAVAERAEHVQPLAALELAERPRPRADRIDQERQLARGRKADAHRPRQHPTWSLEHEELAGDARIELAAIDAEQRVGTDGLGCDDAAALTPHAARVSCSMRSCSECAISSRAFAIASTASRAPDRVVMQGTRAESAAWRISAPSRRAPDPCGVLTTRSQRPALIASTTASPFSSLVTSSPIASSTAAVPAVASRSKPRSVSACATAGIAALSSSRTERNA